MRPHSSAGLARYLHPVDTTQIKVWNITLNRGQICSKKQFSPIDPIPAICISFHHVFLAIAKKPPISLLLRAQDIKQISRFGTIDESSQLELDQLTCMDPIPWVLSIPLARRKSIQHLNKNS